LLNIDIDRIEPLDRRERIGLSGGDQRAGGEQRSSDPAGDRRWNAREIEIDSRRFERCLILSHGGGRLLRGCSGVRIILFAHGFDRGEWLVTFSQSSSRFALGLRIGQIGACLIYGGPVKPRIDLVQRLAGMNQAALLEQARLDQARNLGTDFGRLIGRCASRKFSDKRDRLRRHHHEASLRRLLFRLLLFAASCQQKNNRNRANR